MIPKSQQRQTTEFPHVFACLELDGVISWAFTGSQTEVQHIIIAEAEMSSPSLPLQPPNCLISDRRLIFMNILSTGRSDTAYAALIFTLKEACLSHIHPVVLKQL